MKAYVHNVLTGPHKKLINVTTRDRDKQNVDE
jgi:hypothetical protein